MIVDCIMASYEVDALAVRSAELAGVVDHRVIVYGDITFQGYPQPPLALASTDDTTVLAVHLPRDLGPWQREAYLREASLRAGYLAGGPDALLLLADADEIPHPRAVQQADGPTLLPNDYRQWYMDWRAPDEWQPAHQPLIGRWQDYVEYGGAQSARAAVSWPRAEAVGWHLSTLGDAALAAHKLSSFAHHEDEVQAHNDAALLATRREGGMDLLNRFSLVPTADLPLSAPQFPHLLSTGANDRAC